MFADNPHHSRRWTILAILAIAQLMVVLDATIVNIALPSAQRALHFANSERQWIVTAYALAFGSLLLLGGRISDLFGRKWTFRPADAGVAAATVSASQQIGGSLGTALLSTIATSAIASYITGAHTHPTRLLIAHAAVHGDRTAFAWAAAFFAAGAVIAAALFERGTKALTVHATAAPATAH